MTKINDYIIIKTVEIEGHQCELLFFDWSERFDYIQVLKREQGEEKFRTPVDTIDTTEYAKVYGTKTFEDCINVYMENKAA